MPDIFNPDTQIPVVGDDPLAALVGEGKKFKTVADLATGKQEADAFIVRLQSEAAALRAQLNPQFDAEKELATLRAELAASRANPSGGVPAKADTPALTVDGIAAIVNETITRAEQNRTATQNINIANDAVVAKFGTLEKGTEAVQAKARELGLTVLDLKAMAEKSPTAFQKIVLGEVAQGGSNSPLNPANAPLNTNLNQTFQEGTNAYFDNILKTDKKRYWSASVQTQLHKAVKDGTYQL